MKTKNTASRRRAGEKLPVDSGSSSPLKNAARHSLAPDASELGLDLEGERPREPSGVSRIDFFDGLLG